MPIYSGAFAQRLKHFAGRGRGHCSVGQREGYAKDMCNSWARVLKWEGNWMVAIKLYSVGGNSRRSFLISTVLMEDIREGIRDDMMRETGV